MELISLQCLQISVLKRIHLCVRLFGVSSSFFVARVCHCCLRDAAFCTFPFAEEAAQGSNCVQFMIELFFYFFFLFRLSSKGRYSNFTLNITCAVRDAFYSLQKERMSFTLFNLAVGIIDMQLYSFSFGMNCYLWNIFSIDAPSFERQIRDMGVGTGCHSNVVAAVPTVRSALGSCTLGCDVRVSVLAD